MRFSKEVGNDGDEKEANRMTSRERARRAVSDYVELPIAGLMNRVGITPNMATLIGLLIAAGGAGLAAAGEWWMAGAVALFGGAFDMFDGALARMTNRVSKFGALLDSVVDRVSEAVILFGILAYYLISDNDIGAALAYVAIIGSLMVSYMRARSEGLGIDCKVGVMTRPERVAAVGFGLIAAHWLPVVMPIVLGTIGALTAFTAVHRLIHTAREISSSQD